MTQPRSSQIALSATPYYHCVSRCVRRAFLCGDAYEHRRAWVEDKLLALAEVFCLDIAAFAVMSNHYHVVLFIDSELAERLSDLAIVERWHQLYKGNFLSQRFIRGKALSKAEADALKPIIEEWRSRLMNISWFMRNMNESIARLANAEDGCTGRFWEGRFKSQALLDEKALAACLAYVDLNPIRACMAKTPEQSEHTSVKCRVKKAKTAASPNHKYQQPKALLPFVGNPRKDMPKGLPFKLTDYLDLVDLTGRIMRDDKRGFINKQLPPILSRLNITPDNWLTLTKDFEARFNLWAGDQHSLRRVAEIAEISFVRGGLQGSKLLG